MSFSFIPMQSCDKSVEPSIACVELSVLETRACLEGCARQYLVSRKEFLASRWAQVHYPDIQMLRVPFTFISYALQSSSDLKKLHCRAIR